MTTLHIRLQFGFFFLLSVFISRFRNCWIASAMSTFRKMAKILIEKYTLTHAWRQIISFAPQKTNENENRELWKELWERYLIWFKWNQNNYTVLEASVHIRWRATTKIERKTKFTVCNTLCDIHLLTNKF